MKLTPKVRKTLDIGTRTLIALLSLSYIFYRFSLLPKGSLGVFIDFVAAGNQLVIIGIALFILMLLNWGLESWKWKILIGISEKISLGKAFFAVLGGLASSIFTPNRVGEFVGRVFILKNTNPLKGILLTVVGSFSQLLVTIVAGSVAAVFFAPRFLTPFIPESAMYVTGLVISLIGISGMAMLLYFNIPVLKRIAISLPVRLSKSLNSAIEAISACSRKMLFNIFLISTLRYLVFSLQFYLALRLMGIWLPLVYALQVIPVIYLVLTAIPTIALSEIGVRGSVSVFVFGLIAAQGVLLVDNPLGVVSATTLIWLVNIAIPALAGVGVIFRLKFFRR